MIPPKKQWAIQIDVTNRCVRACSNCTRMIGHARGEWDMKIDDFAQAVRALAGFPKGSPADAHGRRKVVGMIGGEPLLHPAFEELCAVFREELPDPETRGLWTGLDWPRHRHAATIRATFPGGSYINPNDHSRPDGVWHYPVLVAARDAMPSQMQMWAAIWDCPLQRDWSASVTPKGFFFCEVAGALDMIFEGPGGLPVEPDCWRAELTDFQRQIDTWCPRCGMAVPGLAKRRDSEEVDDISLSNLEELRRLGSPRVEAGHYVEWAPSRVSSPGHPLSYFDEGKRK